jgi:hypothetical protein
MPVVAIAQVPGGTAEQGEAIVRRLRLADDPPAGPLASKAGPVEGGWRIVTIWESREAFETFSRERLAPARRQAGPHMPPFAIAPLHSLRFLAQQP